MKPRLALVALLVPLALAAMSSPARADLFGRRTVILDGNTVHGARIDQLASMAEARLRQVAALRAQVELDLKRGPRGRERARALLPRLDALLRATEQLLVEHDDLLSRARDIPTTRAIFHGGAEAVVSPLQAMQLTKETLGLGGTVHVFVRDGMVYVSPVPPSLTRTSPRPAPPPSVAPPAPPRRPYRRLTDPLLA